ncbi:FabD/lysophospholipase-like protein [Pholiota conissans]|uniref:FabD/lysophospholipase-like protein n=1 Tax=Pholiota conissans TaxID=109636 RepID=A0A9P5YRH0_9AGAR|nr:FabD/lysophospholipase-like protein [Pholiota conissans]
MSIPMRFRTYSSHETYTNCKIWEAARATSATPTLFKSIDLGRQQLYVDAGMGCNNPTQMVLDEAAYLFGRRQIGCLMSVGTGRGQVIAIERPAIDIVDVLREITTDCEDMHQQMLRRFTNLPNTYFRVNVEHGMQGFDISDWERLAKVEAHMAQYLKVREVEKKTLRCWLVRFMHRKRR